MLQAMYVQRMSAVSKSCGLSNQTYCIDTIQETPICKTAEMKMVANLRRKVSSRNDLSGNDPCNVWMLEALLLELTVIH